MSATIKYKGETIATASNNTKTLLTAGKYMEANVVVTDNGGGSPTLQTKSVSYTPTESAVSASVTPDTGYDGLDRVNVSVGAIDPNYVGSEVPVRDSSNLTVSDYDEYVTADAGYYPNATTKYLTPKLKPSPVVSLNTSNGRVTATATYSTSDETVGYHDSGTAVGTLQLVTKSARTYTPTTADQTISSGQYLIGNQTILGDADLVAENIRKDVNIFGVTGTYEGSGATLQTRSVTIVPTETATTQTVTPSSGYDGLSQVTVNVGAISSTYVGSEVPRKSSSDLTASGATVTAPAGFYPANASKAIPNASQALTDAYVHSSGDLEVELNTSSGGYVANGNQYLQFEDFTTPVPTTTYYATSSDQVIMSQNSMAFGAQTIKGVTTNNLLASNIKKGVVVEVGDSADPDRIVSVTGTYEGGGGGNDLLDYTSPSGAYTSSGTTAKVGAFYGRTGITSLNLPSLTSAMDYAFAYMTNLTSVSMPNLASVGIRAFDHSANITSISLPMLTTSGTHTFADCTNLETIDCPLLTSVPANFLASCEKYKNVVLPSVTTLGASAFDYGKSKDHGYLVLGKRGKTSTLSTLQAIGWNLMRGSIFSVVDCAMPLNMNGNSQGSVTTLILRSTTMSTLSNVNYRLGGVTDIYVPSALLSSYQSASNWSTLYSGGTITLTAIEGSYYETHYADGTTIS